MRRGTTPTITMIFPEHVPVTALEEAVFSVAQNGKELVQKRLADMEIVENRNALRATLTQEDTLALNRDEYACIQMKVRMGDTVLASDVKRMSVEEILNEDVI